jgi:hypothetical protein
MFILNNIRIYKEKSDRTLQMFSPEKSEKNSKSFYAALSGNNKNQYGYNFEQEIDKIVSEKYNFKHTYTIKK